MIRARYIPAILCLLGSSLTARAEQQHGGMNGGMNQQQQFQGGSMAMGAGGGMGMGGGGGSAKYEKNKEASKTQEYAKESIKEMNESTKSFGQAVDKMSSSFGQALEKTKVAESSKMLDELTKNATNVVSGEGVGKTAVDDIVNSTKLLSDTQAQTIQAAGLALQAPPKAEEVVQAITVADKMAGFVSGRGVGSSGRSALGIAAQAAPIGQASTARAVSAGRGVSSIDSGLTYKAPSFPKSRN